MADEDEDPLLDLALVPADDEEISDAAEPTERQDGGSRGGTQFRPFLGALLPQSSTSDSDNDYQVGRLSPLYRLLNAQDATSPTIYRLLQSSDSNDSDRSSENDFDEREDSHTFDPAIATRHSYLGEVDDLHGGYSILKEGTVHKLPFIEAVVLFPGGRLPLRVTTRERLAVEKALAADPPLERLLVIVLSPHRDAGSHCNVGCTAEIRQMRRHSDGVISLVAKGLQRVKLVGERDRHGLTAVVEVMADGSVPPMPKEFRTGGAHCPPWACRYFDPHKLAAKAHEKAQAIVPNLPDLTQDPLAFSYWMAANLPLFTTDAGINTHQELLESATSTDRLRRQLKLMSEVGGLFCIFCHQQIARCEDVMSMSEEGPSGVFVNPHGHVFDMITLRLARSISLHGRPDTNYSWFPGYAWTIADCRMCGSHLGWRFTAAEKGLAPPSFYGLQRSRLVHTRR